MRISMMTRPPISTASPITSTSRFIFYIALILWAFPFASCSNELQTQPDDEAQNDNKIEPDPPKVDDGHYSSSSLRSSSSELSFSPEEKDMQWWPWNRNKTTHSPTISHSPSVTPSMRPSAIPSVTPSMSPTEVPDNSTIACNLREECEDCIGRCHWCAKDNKCHTKGSFYGCSWGTSCDAPPKPAPKPDPVDSSCHAHQNCAECSLASNFCHWCAFDDKCHAIGSMYGCLHGTNCYSNDRCQRDAPEAIVDTSIFEDIGFVPIALIVMICACSFCCTSLVYGGVTALKGAYDELAEARRIPPPTPSSPSFGQTNGDDSGRGVVGAAAGPPLEAFSHGEREISATSSNGGTGSTEREGLLEGVSGKNEENEDNCNSDEVKHDINEEGDDEDEEHADYVELGANNINTSRDDNALTDTSLLLEVNAYPDPSRLPPRRVESHHMTCLMRLCRTWYTLTMLGLSLSLICSIYFFPKIPSYNVCSDEFAWKSIIDGLTSLKMEASFELLVSIENKNKLNIELEGFGGKFKHDGEDVGTFSVPSNAVIGAQSITDILITCTVVPNKWEALGLISDYYKGNLVFFVDVNGAVKVTGIHYSFPVKETDVLVRVNDPNMDDRHLCACPEWKDITPAPTKAPLAIPQFMEDIEHSSRVSIY